MLLQLLGEANLEDWMAEDEEENDDEKEVEKNGRKTAGNTKNGQDYITKSRNGNGVHDIDSYVNGSKNHMKTNNSSNSSSSDKNSHSHNHNQSLMMNHNNNNNNNNNGSSGMDSGAYTDLSRNGSDGNCPVSDQKALNARDFRVVFIGKPFDMVSRISLSC